MLRIYGHSDDLVEIEGDVNEELNTDNAVLLIGREDDGGLVARVSYAHNNRAAVWGVSVEPVDEEVPIPWPVGIKLEPEHGYSAVLIVSSPPGTLVRKLEKSGTWARLQDKESEDSEIT